MNVLYITSWNCACGIHTYSRNLIEHLEKIGVNVQVYSGTNDYLGLTNVANHCTADLVHIQHEYGISVPTDALMSIISKFKAKGVPVVITTHTEDDGFNIMLDGVPDAFVLHNDKQNLHKRQMFSRFYKIPHGIPEVTFKESKAFYRQKYGIPEDAFVIGTCGFLSSDRAQMLETFVTAFLAQAKAHPEFTKPYYFNFVMSAHRSDNGGQFANLIKNTLTTLAIQHGIPNSIYVNTEFIPTEEFRERIYTMDIGFSYGNPKVQSNSGSAADLLSCGIPTVVNDAQHFKHIAPYCTVVDGDVTTIAEKVFVKYGQNNPNGYIYEGWTSDPTKAISDLGYSRVAQRHKELYMDVIYKFPKEQVASTPVKLKKDLPITIKIPNQLWQVPVLWTRIQHLVDDGYKIRLAVQNEELLDIGTLQYVLPGIAEVVYADVGMQQDPRVLRMQSDTISQNMSFDLERFVTQGHSLFDLLPAQGPISLPRFNLGAHAHAKVEELNITADTGVVVASEEVLSQVCELDVCPWIVLGTPLTTKYVHEIVLALKARQSQSEVTPVITDFRTCWAIVQKANKIATGFNDCAVIAALAGNLVQIIDNPLMYGLQRSFLKELQHVGLSTNVKSIK